MNYQHGRTLQAAPTILSVEQARQRNAELRRELAGLTFENERLQDRINTMRIYVKDARRKLTRQVRNLEACRIQTERLSQSVVATSTLPEPVYGGREGLQAAADEIEAYDAKHGKLGTVTRRGPRHGTGRKYALGCRCDECAAWRVKRTEVQRATSRKRKDAA